MSKIVNLNQFRKQRARRDRDKTTTENRAKFGRTKGERARQLIESRRQSTDLDSKLLEDGPPSDETPDES